MKYLLNNFSVKEHIQRALIEDIGFGDITTDSIYDENYLVKAVVNSRSEGIICGIDIVKAVYEILDPAIKFNALLKDGDKIAKNQDLAIIEGSCRTILSGERVALNYIQRMSAIATLANKYQEAVKPYKTKVVDTRKTTPGFRIFEKYAVITGGAYLHRFNLSDCIMLKDNHIQYMGSINAAVEKVRQKSSHVHKIEVEVETLEQVKEALNVNVDIIMLDNMSIEEMKEAVNLINNKA
ncbi:MAG: carboxylating nicotinate-nucleotide diphosphorylase, partial [Candidatus Gastranaerophilaceae bacterium]